jgi:hypothetical protein
LDVEFELAALGVAAPRVEGESGRTVHG